MSRLRRETVTVRGESFTVREWTSAERAEVLKQRESDQALASTVVAYHCVIKEDGTRYFPSVDAVRAEPASLIDDLAAEIFKLSAGDDEKNA